MHTSPAVVTGNSSHFASLVRTSSPLGYILSYMARCCPLLPRVPKLRASSVLPFELELPGRIRLPLLSVRTDEDADLQLGQELVMHICERPA